MSSKPEDVKASVETKRAAETSHFLENFDVTKLPEDWQLIAGNIEALKDPECTDCVQFTKNVPSTGFTREDKVVKVIFARFRHQDNKEAGTCAEDPKSKNSVCIILVGQKLPVLLDPIQSQPLPEGLLTEWFGKESSRSLDRFSAIGFGPADLLIPSSSYNQLVSAEAQAALALNNTALTDIMNYVGFNTEAMRQSEFEKLVVLWKEMQLFLNEEYTYFASLCKMFGFDKPTQSELFFAQLLDKKRDLKSLDDDSCKQLLLFAKATHSTVRQEINKNALQNYNKGGPSYERYYGLYDPSCTAIQLGDFFVKMSEQSSEEQQKLKYYQHAIEAFNIIAEGEHRELKESKETSEDQFVKGAKDVQAETDFVVDSPFRLKAKEKISEVYDMLLKQKNNKEILNQALKYKLKMLSGTFGWDSFSQFEQSKIFGGLLKLLAENFKMKGLQSVALCYDSRKSIDFRKTLIPLMLELGGMIYQINNKTALSNVSEPKQQQDASIIASQEADHQSLKYTILAIIENAEELKAHWAINENESEEDFGLRMKKEAEAFLSKTMKELSEVVASLNIFCGFTAEKPAAFVSKFAIARHYDYIDFYNTLLPLFLDLSEMLYDLQPKDTKSLAEDRKSSAEAKTESESASKKPKAITHAFEAATTTKPAASPSVALSAGAAGAGSAETLSADPSEAEGTRLGASVRRGSHGSLTTYSLE